MPACGVMMPPRFCVLLTVVLLSLATGRSLFAAEPTNKICPIMTEDEADAEAVVSYQGKDIYFCCSPCVKQFRKEPDYYVALFQVMKSVPAVQNFKVPDGIQLLEQRFCPFSTKRLVGPSSPSVEYKGVKVYFSKPGHLNTWKADPDGYAKEAVAKGLLPQLKGKI
jgi:YHS domain-containing protein